MWGWYEHLRGSSIEFELGLDLNCCEYQVGIESRTGMSTCAEAL